MKFKRACLISRHDLLDKIIQNDTIQLKTISKLTIKNSQIFDN